MAGARRVVAKDASCSRGASGANRLLVTAILLFIARWSRLLVGRSWSIIFVDDNLEGASFFGR